MKKILQKIITLVLISVAFVFVEASESIIVLSQQKTKESINQELQRYQEMVTTHGDLLNIQNQENIGARIEELPNHFILKLKSFENTNNLTSAYLILKESFPTAFILEDNSQPKVTFSYREQREEDSQLLWIAIFSLALIGILGLFFSSMQIKKIMIRHTQMQDKQNKIEAFLTNMGENIYSLSKKNVNYKKTSVENLSNGKTVSNRDLIDKKLFDTTRVMINFLRLKSKKVSILQEKFNLNNLLNGVLGTIAHTFEGSDIELIFEVENSVPKNIIGDPLHLSEILTELLQNAMKHTQKGEVKLSVSISSGFSLDDKLQFEVSDTGGGISDKGLEMLFIPRYTDTEEYKGLGLYVANELASLMRGELSIKSTNSSGTTFLCSLPLLLPDENERRVYRLPDQSYTKKRVLVYDNNENASLAIKKMFGYFHISTDIISPQKFNEKGINLAQYDIILLDINNLTRSKIMQIRDIRKKQPLKIVHLSSCFSTKRYIAHDYSDDWVQKPISQERIYELLLSLYEPEKIHQNAKMSQSLKVIRPDNLVETKNITTNNFTDFKNHHLLIVEDNIIDQKVMLSILGKAGIEITIASNGKEALERLQDTQNSYDLILMDISMPIMDGYETIQAIRDNDRFDTTPIIALTSLALDNDVTKMFRVGSNAYIRKPLKIGYLYTALNHFIGDMKDFIEPSREEEKLNSKEEGLDISRGIEHANGSHELYREVLEEFLTAYGDSANSLKVWVADNRYEQIKRLCLDMKGLTGAIGAYNMFELVDTMHKQFLYNNIHLIPKFVESYELELKKLVKTIHLYMDGR